MRRCVARVVAVGPVGILAATGLAAVAQGVMAAATTALVPVVPDLLALTGVSVMWTLGRPAGPAPA